MNRRAYHRVSDTILYVLREFRALVKILGTPQDWKGILSRVSTPFEIHGRKQLTRSVRRRPRVLAASAGRHRQQFSGENSGATVSSVDPAPPRKTAGKIGQRDEQPPLPPSGSTNESTQNPVLIPHSTSCILLFYDRCKSRLPCERRKERLLDAADRFRPLLRAASPERIAPQRPRMKNGSADRKRDIGRFRPFVTDTLCRLIQ